MKILKAWTQLVHLSSVLLLVQCSGVSVKEQNEPVKPLPSQLAEQVEASEETRALYREIIDLIETARRVEGYKNDRAIGYYIEAAERSEQSRNPAFIPLYNHAVGQVADLLTDWTGKNVFDGKTRRYRFSYGTKRLHGYQKSDFEQIAPTDCLKLKGWKEHVVVKGVGAPMVAVYGTTEGQQEPFLDSLGGEFPLTAVLEFPSSGRAQMRFYDPMQKQTLRFWGKTYPLSGNFSAPLAVAMERKLKDVDVKRILGVLKPLDYAGRMGLYAGPPFDADKIPVVLVHGLVSSPGTWIDTLNGLMKNPDIRSRYQFYTYYYPTGLPVRVTSAQLKRDLYRLHQHYVEGGGKHSADQMVLVGHSMGGILSSILVRSLEPEDWKLVSSTPLERIHLNPLVKKDISYLLNHPRPPFIKRVVFICTPHRGSELATTWFGKMATSLIKLPKSLATLKIDEAAGSLTELGKNIFSGHMPDNSMVSLQENDPLMELLVGAPVAPSITYHSMMGDRGRGDTPESSDGVVKYNSSHIDGAASEKIIPSNHSSHVHPVAVKELDRILMKHLKK